MELLLGYLGYELLGTVILAVTVYMMVRKEIVKQKKVSKLEQIAAETARLEAENERLELEYEARQEEKFNVLEPSRRPLEGHSEESDRFAADCRAARLKIEFDYYRMKGELPANSLLDSRALAELTSYYESQITSAFSVILTDSAQVEFRK